MRRYKVALLATFIVAVSLMVGQSLAHDYEKGDITVIHPRTKESVGKNAAIYVTLENKGTEVDRLIGAETDIARDAQLHTHIVEDNIVKMRRLEALEVRPGTPTVLERGGHHIMLVGLKKRLREGELAPLTLILERAGRIKIEAYVEGWAQSDDAAPAKKNSHEHGS